MFTGIITEVGEVVYAELRDEWFRVGIRAPATAARASIGSSVAVSGVCLTVNSIADDGIMDFSVLPQTLAVTTLGDWRAGTHVNLESSLRVGDELGGHFVYGHVDGLVHVSDVRRVGDSVHIRCALPPELMRYVAPKGSIALDGTSLTIAELGTDWIEVALVEYTLAHTTLSERVVGDRLHVECDMLMKFIASRDVFSNSSRAPESQPR